MSRKQDVERRRIIGKNLATARKLSGLSQSDVMLHVWGEENTRQKNRISEIENGADTLPDAELLCVLCQLYGVSADYILGFSVEPEIDMTAGRFGVMYNGLRSTLTDHLESVVEELSRIGAQQMAQFPKPSMMGMLHAGKDVYREFDKQRELVPTALAQAIGRLFQEIRHCDQQMAVTMNHYDMLIGDIVERPDSVERHSLLSDQPAPTRKRYPCTSLPKDDHHTSGKKKGQMSLFVHDGTANKVEPLI